jgi:hypothetical protein
MRVGSFAVTKLLPVRNCGAGWLQIDETRAALAFENEVLEVPVGAAMRLLS